MAAIKGELKWLILGANGQLGQALQQELSLRNIEFVAFGHSQLDIANEDQIESSLELEKPDVIVNAAAWTNVDLAEKEESHAFSVNAFGPALLASKSLVVGSKFIHISTDYVFSGIAQSPWQETQVRCPVSAYGRSKAEGERLVIECNQANSFIVRTAWLYSQYEHNFAKTMLRLALRGSTKVEVVDDQMGQPTYALDLASQLTQLIHFKASPGIYHGTNAGETTWYLFAKEIFSLAGVDPERVVPVRSDHFPQVAKRPSYSVLGHKRWIDEGMKPMRHWKEALTFAFPAILDQVNSER